ncbi:MAG: hypothetical protein R2876_01320 [Eubacteriales bacterium]
MYYIFFRKIKEEILSNKLLFTLVAFVGLTGVAAGVFTVFGFDQWLKEQIIENISNIISNSS